MQSTYAVHAPSVSAEKLARMAAALRRMRTLPEILDDIGDALDPQPPEEDEVEEIHGHLRDDLERLAAIAIAAESRDAEVLRLAERAASLQAVDLPDHFRDRVLHLRLVGTVANDLLERLTATRAIKQVA
ncbi:DUF6415 family natural product biosynthesis protein [Streptomyces sp. NRRL S-920]|uniref:DUF6415 family natural product biosynthesis protein n=1 Tax=Streptomyces sp. NRRL S-920 TaxID=1463921 RepID=UPI0004C50929|nr:DUF6415 family natural product biosynthesis protein [Streptomyces sp. NRRL S-920]